MTQNASASSSPKQAPADAGKQANNGAKRTAGDRWSFSRSTLPYLVAAVLASAAMAWYFFVFVPSKLDYFVGLRFRTLAVASGQVKSKAETLARSLDNVRRTAPGGESVDPAEARVDAKAAEAAKAAEYADAADYLEILVPDIQLLDPARAASGPSPRGLRLSAKGLTATVAWENVVAQASAASARDFDDLILADASGEVVWQREKTTARIGNLTELLYADDAAGGGWSLTWNVRHTIPNAKIDQPLPATATVKPVTLGGTSSLLLVQAVPVDPAGIILPPGKGDSTANRLYVAGLVSRGALQRQAMQIPVVWLVLFALPVVLLFLALPFVKLATLTSKERYSFADVVLLAIGTVAAASLGAVVPFMSAFTQSTGDETLSALAKQIEDELGKETLAILSLADTILMRDADLVADPWEACAVPGHPEMKCGLWQKLKELPSSEVRAGSFELDVVIWLDDRGTQTRKWSTKAQVTGLASHRPFDHFRDLQFDRTWTLDGPAPQTPTTAFTIEPLRVPTTAELGIVFARPISPDPTTGKRRSLVVNVRSESLVDPVMPPGYGFAVLAPSGRVLFHSEEGLSLEENFFAEVGNPTDVREKARSSRRTWWSGDYHGRPHQLHMQKISKFINCPWLIVTFREMDPVLAAQVQHQSGTFRLAVLNLALLGPLALSFWAYSKSRHRDVRDLMMRPSPVDVRWTAGLAALTVVAGVAISATYLAPARWLDWLYGFFVLLPLLALLVAVAARSRKGTDGFLPARVRAGLLAAELGLLVVLIGAAPAAGFARLVSRVQDLQATERWLEEVQQRVSARHSRVMERVHGSNYTESTKKILTGEGGFAAPGRTSAYSYLTLQPGITAGPEPGTAQPTDDPSAGQGLLRFFLNWTFLTSGDEPGQTRVRAVNESLRIEPANAGQSALVAVPNVGAEDGRVAWGSVFLGLVIVGGTIAAPYWARGKLVAPPLVPAPSLQAAIADVPLYGNQGILLIGPPRTTKDQAVHETVAKETGAEPGARIRLLDAEITPDFITDRLKEIDGLVKTGTPGLDRSGRLWIHLSNLESHLVDQHSRTRVLQLLEKLLEGKPDQPPRVVVATTSVDPIAHFDEIFQEERQGIYADVVPEVQLSRSSLLLSRFRRCYLPIDSAQFRNTWLQQSWDTWWDYKPETWKETLRWEVEGYPPLAVIGKELGQAWPESASVPLGELAGAVKAKATASYELLWTSCTRSEKLVLIQLAQEGFVTTQSRNVVAPLIAKGLIIERPAPAIFNRTFRSFLRRIERNHVVHEWERMEGHGLWVVSGRLIASSLVAGGIFYLLTQDFSVQSLLPIVSGTGVFGVPLVRNLMAWMSRKGGSAAVSA